MSRYPIPARRTRVQESIQRSRFITSVAHADTPESAHRFIDEIRTEFEDATHNCWAFVAGAPGDTAHIGMSDDGEPHGTAGRPMLRTLLHSGVGEVVAVCTRYYGGVKLGTGGLARAYASGVVSALESLETRLKVNRVDLRISMGYADLEGLRRLIDEVGAVVRTEEYGADVRIVCGVPEEEVEAFVSRVRDLTKGGGKILEE